MEMDLIQNDKALSRIHFFDTLLIICCLLFVATSAFKSTLSTFERRLSNNLKRDLSNFDTKLSEQYGLSGISPWCLSSVPDSFRRHLQAEFPRSFDRPALSLPKDIEQSMRKQGMIEYLEEIAAYQQRKEFLDATMETKAWSDLQKEVSAYAKRLEFMEGQRKDIIEQHKILLRRIRSYEYIFLFGVIAMTIVTSRLRKRQS